MHQRFLLPLIFIASSAPAYGSPGADQAPAVVDYNRDIRPILTENCLACHGPDEAHRKAKLRLDQRDSAVQQRKRGAAIVPGKPEKSSLFQRVTAEEDERMPPPDTGLELNATQIALLKRWIEQGAPYAEHWAFVKPKATPLPSVNDGGWPRNGIDHFVVARLEKEGLKPNAEADRYTLLRRVSLDLRGLPPTPAELDAFIRDTSPGAYERAVDRFLSDSAYGERWAKMWLDLARYADSAGYGSDPLRPNMWRYRDWVIDAFNRNLPYDQFTMEQLAGDLLPSPTLEQKMATAFHRNTMTNTEGGTDDEEFRVAAVKDRVETTMQVWMGLTMGCAKCHTHKYDPLAQKEYYQFYAFFNQTADNDQADESPTIRAPTSEQVEQKRRFDEKLAPHRRQLERPALTAVAGLALQRGLVPPPEWLQLYSTMARLHKRRPAISDLPILQEVPPEKRRTTKLMNKGNFLDLSQTVDPGTPAALQPFPKDAPLNRLGVAKWLVDPNNPLTARVAVNRYWSRLFGTGIVETEEDFGTQGELPSHPELLDWLANEYVRLNWDTKALLKLIVTAATYRQSSQVTREKLAKDPRNRLLARGPRFRLEAETVRDQALQLSGLLSRKIGGPSVYPPQPDGLWQAAFNGQRSWPTSKGEDRYRRGLYTFWRRTVPYPSMAAFDAPSREICSVRRIHTNTPLQAFVTLNDPVYVEAAQALARRIVKEGGASVEDRVGFGLRLCQCRPPEAEQIKHLTALFASERQHYSQNREEATKLATDPLGPLPAGADPADMAAWTVVANVLLNLDGVLMKG